MAEDFRWYEFETRMRNMIVQLLEPTVQRLTKQREKLISAKKKLKVFDEKIGSIETLLGLGKQKSGWMEDIENNVKGLSLRISDVIVSQESQNNRFQIFSDKLSAGLTSTGQKLEGLSQRNEELDKQISILGTSQNTQTEFLTKFLQSNKEDYSQQFSKMMSENTNTQSKYEEIISQMSEVSQKMNSFQMFIEKNRVQQSEFSMKIQKLAIEKIENEHLMLESSKLNSKIQQISEKLKKSDDKIHEIFRYIDAYLPKEVQAYISDSIG